MPKTVAALAFSLAMLRAQAPANGPRLFTERCAGCHGDDGSGGGHGPAIIGPTKQRAPREVIAKGIPGSPMPAFPMLTGAELDALTAHVEWLRGDASTGATVFRERCASCHTSSPAGTEHQTGAALTIRLNDGKVLRGIAKNESPFDLQLLGTDNRLHLLLRSQIAEITRSPAPPKIELAAKEHRDLGAYIARSRDASREPAAAYISKPDSKQGDWPTYDGTYSGNRFSPLAEINTETVSRLGPQWMYTLRGTPGTLEMTPIVAEGVMYVTSVNEAYALDARTGREIWHYKRPRTANLAGDAASGINRGVALHEGRVFLVTDNAHLLALDRLSGALLWDVEMADSRQNYGATGAPLVVGDLVIAGVSGGDEGIRGFLDAYRAATGERAWRFWTIPAPGEPGAETWSGRAIEHGCGATWFTGTYDPLAQVLYWPTGNPCPDYNGDERQGDNLYTSSVLALDPLTGKLRWHYQFTPHDLHDWDATETPMLVDAIWRGQPRKLLLQGNRNGFFYVLDRTTGKVLMAEPFVRNITWASGIGEDGRPKLLPGNDPTAEGQRVCPSVSGAANWPSSAFSHKTGLFYLFASEACTVYSKNGQWWEAGKSFYGGGTRRSPADPPAKYLRALDIQTGRIAWEIPTVKGAITESGLIATAGDLIFYNDGDGAFVAADASNGKLLWHFNTGQNSKASPMTYTIDGHQYIATVTGSTVIAFGLR